MSVEQEAKLQQYASQHICDMEIIDKLEKENEDLQNNSLKYYNESRQLKDELETIKLVSEVDKQHNSSNNSTILEQYGEIEKLKGDIEALNNDITNTANENEELNKAIDFKNNCFYELNDKYIELGKENKNLLEIIDNYRKGIENSNIELAEFKGVEEKLKGEIVNLKQLLKAVTYLL